MAEGKLVEVYRAVNGMEAQVIKSLLDSYGIPSVLKTNAAPSILMFTADGLGEVKIMVLEAQAAEARELVKGENQCLNG